jgi:hypothetical protein
MKASLDFEYANTFLVGINGFHIPYGESRKEKYIFASKISYTTLRTNEQHYLSNFIIGSRTFHL